VLTFGLGSLTKADAVEIQWPSGQVDKLAILLLTKRLPCKSRRIVGTRHYKGSKNCVLTLG